MKFYSLLSHFSDCHNLHIKSDQQLLKIEGGGVQPIWAVPIFRPFFFKGLPIKGKIPQKNLKLQLYKAN